MRWYRQRIRALIGSALCMVAMSLAVMSCAKQFDMSGQQVMPLGPEWGLVIGSVLVQPEQKTTGKDGKGRDVSGTYEFDIVQSQPGDPYGESPYIERYHLDAKAGEERIFVSRLRSGEYLIKNFHESGVRGIGGDLNLAFASMAGEVRYVGRVLVEIPQRVSSGKGYRFVVENAREPTLAHVAKQDTGLTKDVLNVPMQARGDIVP